MFGVGGAFYLITSDKVLVLQSILSLHISGCCPLIGRLLPNYHESLVAHISLSCLVRTANGQAVAPPTPLGCPCQNAGSRIVLLISLRKDSVMGRSRDKEQKEQTDC